MCNKILKYLYHVPYFKNFKCLIIEVFLLFQEELSKGFLPCKIWYFCCFHFEWNFVGIIIHTIIFVHNWTFNEIVTLLKKSFSQILSLCRSVKCDWQDCSFVVLQSCQDWTGKAAANAALALLLHYYYFSIFLLCMCLSLLQVLPGQKILVSVWSFEILE